MPRSPLYEGFSHDAMFAYGRTYDQRALAAPNDVLIKPTHACQARCPYCQDMLQWYYRERKSAPAVPHERWLELIREFAELRVPRITISGGEPTLYPRLAEIIRAAKELGLLVSVNSNGWRFANEDYTVEFLRSGVDVVVLSVDSHEAEVHDECRKLPGLFDRLSRGLTILFEQRTTGQNVGVRTVIHRANIEHFDELLQFLSRWPLDFLRISYIEDDFSRQEWLPTRSQIETFHTDVLPRCLDHVRRMCADGIVRAEAERRLKALFVSEVTPIDAFAVGEYWPDESIRSFCDLPSRFALVTPVGEVLPCNESEYTEGPSMGNVTTQSFAEIWNGDAFEEFRHSKYDRCRVCAGPLPFQVTFRDSNSTKVVAAR